MRVLRGTVVTGQGNFSYWIGQLQEHYGRKTGMLFYPGTLNIELAEPFSFPPDALRLEGSEYGGCVSVNMVPCSVRGRPAFLLRTDLNESGNGPHPKTIVEIATDVRLRDYFSLNDGDALDVEIEG